MTDERKPTYSEAVNNQWAIAAHRIAYAKANGKPCKCKECLEHMRVIAEGPEK